MLAKMASTPPPWISKGNVGVGFFENMNKLRQIIQDKRMGRSHANDPFDGKVGIADLSFHLFN